MSIFRDYLRLLNWLCCCWLMLIFDCCCGWAIFSSFVLASTIYSNNEIWLVNHGDLNLNYDKKFSQNWWCSIFAKVYDIDWKFIYQLNQLGFMEREEIWNSPIANRENYQLQLWWNYASICGYIPRTCDKMMLALAGRGRERERGRKGREKEKQIKFNSEHFTCHCQAASQQHTIHNTTNTMYIVRCVLK